MLVYDIPASWTLEKILNELTLWGKTISLSCKTQRKYQTVRVKIELSSFSLAVFYRGDWTTSLGGMPVRWFPASWTLRERKERDRFQAAIMDIPDSMTLATLWENNKAHEFLNISGCKSFKIIQTSKGHRKLVRFLRNGKICIVH
jgi:hypothetical protein